MYKFKVKVIDENNNAVFVNYCKNKREVKNVLKCFNGTKNYITTKNNKLFKKLSSKNALEIVNNSTFIF